MHRLKSTLRRVAGKAVRFASRPSTAQGFHNLGLSLSHAGRWEEALQAYRRGLSRDPSNIELWRALIGAPKEAGYAEDIKALLESLVPGHLQDTDYGFVVALQKIDGTHELAARYIGGAFRDRDLSQLEGVLNGLRQGGHVDRRFLKSLSDYFWENGPAAHSLLPSELYLNEHRHLHLLFRASEIHAIKGNNEELRLGYLEEVVQFDAASAMDSLVIALAFTRLQKWDKALEAYKSGLSLAPRDIELWSALLHSPKEADYAEPIRSLLRILNPKHLQDMEHGFVIALNQIDNTQLLAARYIGMEFRDQDLSKLEMYLAGLQKGGHVDRRFFKSLSDYFWESGQPEYSLPPSEFYLQEHRHLHLLFRASEIYAIRGNNEDRRKAYLEEVIQFDSASPTDCLVVGLALTRLRRWDEAVKTYEDGLNRWPTDRELWRGYAESSTVSGAIFPNFARYTERHCPNIPELIYTLSPLSAVYFLKHFKSETRNIDPNEITDFIVQHLAASNLQTAIKTAELYISNSAISNAFEFQDRFSRGIIQEWTNRDGDEFVKAAFRVKLQKLFSRALVFEEVIDDERFVRDFCSECQTLMSEAIELDEPLADLGGCTPWVPIYTRAVPHLYSEAALAIHNLSVRVWPRLTWTAPHVVRGDRPNNKKIKIGFTCLDFMPMISGLMERLDSTKFERTYLRPKYPHPGGETARNWVARADRTVNLPTDSVYSIQEAFAREELDLLVAGPSIPSGVYPMMARLAPLQMTIIEPNWCDSFANVDYYISWSSAEPTDFKTYHNNAIALMEHPPYWLDKPAQPKKTMRTDVTALAGAPTHKRVYVCPTSPVKLHPAYDEVLEKLLLRDPEGIVVFHRMDSPWAQAVQNRMVNALGSLAERLVFLPTLTPKEAHELLNAVDCVLDAYPLGGMSSSFIAAAIGTPTVSLPAEMPFGKWMGAIYDYIGVDGLTASSSDEYAEIAYRLASDVDWREAKSSEIRSKQNMLVESEASAGEFETFLLTALKRHEEGLSPTDWVNGTWIEN